jgi:hypothetical protein
MAAGSRLVRTPLIARDLADPRLGSLNLWKQSVEREIDRLASLTPNGFSDAEVPAGAVDGVNRIFTLAHAPNPPSSLVLAINGSVQGPGYGGDFQLSGATITTATPPSSGSLLLAWYRY